MYSPIAICLPYTDISKHRCAYYSQFSHKTHRSKLILSSFYGKSLSHLPGSHDSAICLVKLERSTYMNHLSSSPDWAICLGNLSRSKVSVT